MKTLRFKTNYNHKLSCDRFIHIDQVPRGPVTDSILEKTVIEITTMDNSHPAVLVKAYDLMRIPVKEIPSHLIQISHGMEKIDFINFIHKEIPNLTAETELAIYCYKKYTD